MQDLDSGVALVVEVEAHSGHPPQIVEAAPAHDHQAVSLNHLDGTAVVGHDLLQLAEDRLERVFEAQRRPERLRHGEEGLGMLTCALELGEVARLVDGGRGEGGKGLCHLRVFGGVEVGLERVERHHPDQAIADEQRDPHPSLDTAAAVGLLPEVLEPRRHVRDDDRLEPLDQFACGIIGSPPVEALSEQFVEVRKAMAADDHHLVALELLDAGSSVGHDFAQLRQDQVEDFGRP